MNNISNEARNEPTHLWAPSVRLLRNIFRDELNSSEMNFNDPDLFGRREVDITRKFFRNMLSAIDLSKVKSILDVGCAVGDLVPFLQEEHPECELDRYLGIDLLPETLEYARQQYGSEKIQFKEIDFLSVTPEGLGKFDLITACGVFMYHVRDYESYLETVMEHMPRLGGHSVFNVITQIDRGSEFYPTIPTTGQPRGLEDTVLQSILYRPNVTSKSFREFPDSTDTFIQIFSP